MTPYPTALTIAGSDSGGGAGIQADLKTFLDHGVFGMSAIAAITAQNSIGVTRVDPVPVEGLRAQLEAVFADFEVDAVKIGMLGSAAHVRCVADFLGGLGQRPPIVLDPVMVASTGHRLLEPEAERVLVEQLVPLATLVTPNREEHAVLGDDLPVPVLITGGDVVGHEIVDVLGERVWRHPRVGDRPFHGTGCTLSSAIAARLARGEDLEDAVDGGIAYVQGRIRAAARLGSVGHGNPSLPHGLQ